MIKPRQETVDPTLMAAVTTKNLVVTIFLFFVFLVFLVFFLLLLLLDSLGDF